MGNACGLGDDENGPKNDGRKSFKLQSAKNTELPNFTNMR